MRKVIRTVMVGLALAGCSRAVQTVEDPNARMAVTVDNMSFRDYNIYVSSEGGLFVRVGFAPQKSTTTIGLPANLIGRRRTLRFEARPIASSVGPVSEDIMVAPGDTVTLQIPPG